MLEALHKPVGPFGNTAFVIMDPLAAPRLHVDRLNILTEIMPVVTVWPEAVTTPYLRDHDPERPKNSTEPQVLVVSVVRVNSVSLSQPLDLLPFSGDAVGTSLSHCR